MVEAGVAGVTQDSIDAEFDDKPQFGGSKFRTFKLNEKNPTMTLRFFVMKSLKRNRRSSSFRSVHWYRGTQPDGSAKPKSWPVLSNEEGKFEGGKFVVTKPDPMRELRKRSEEALKRLEANANLPKDNPAYVDPQTYGQKKESIKGWQRDHGFDQKHRLYAVDLENNLGVAYISGRTFKSLLAECEKYQKDKGVNPFDSTDGVFFTFTRTGNGFTVPDKVEVYRREQDIPNVGKVDIVVKHTLTPELKRAAVEILPDFDEEDARIRFSDEVMVDLAKAANDPAQVTAIILAAKPELARAARTGGDSGESAQDYQGDADFDTGSTASPPASAAATAKPNPMDKIADTAAKAAASAKPGNNPAPTANPGKMSDADFDAEFGA